METALFLFKNLWFVDQIEIWMLGRWYFGREEKKQILNEH